MSKNIVFVSLFCCIMLFAQTVFGQDKTADYEAMWKTFDKDLNDGLPQSAVKVLDKIEHQAVKEKNELQRLKTVLNRGRVFSMTEDDYIQVFIQYLKTQLPNFSGAHKAFLNIALATNLNNYQRKHNYIIGRNQHIEGSYDDVELKFWDDLAFETEINRQIEAALSADSILKLTPTKDLELLFYEEEMDYELEPTLFDYVAHTVQKIYNTESLQAKRNDAWDTNLWWLPAESFTALGFQEDANNTILKTLGIYAELLKFDEKHGFRKAYLYNDMSRLDFLSQVTDDDKGEKYISALEVLRQENAKEEVSAELAAIEAQKLCFQYENNRDDSLYRTNYIKALNICNDAIAAFPVSKGAKSCEEIKKFILNEEVAFTIQKVVLPGRPIPIALDYRNAINPAYRIVKLSPSEILDSESDLDLFKKKILRRLPVVENELDFPPESDHLYHSTLLALPELEHGLYALMFSATGDFKNDQKIIFELFQVSDMSLVTDDQNNGVLCYVLDRQTGKPVSGVKAEIFSYAYDYHIRRRKATVLGCEISDKNGSFLVNLPKSQFSINLYNGIDTLMSNDIFHHSSRHESDFVERTNFFTDRAIYRPGQTVHFKGIIMKTKDDEKQIVANKQTQVVFIDANYQEIASLTLLTNEYGSFDGSFVIPFGLLHGDFQLSNENGSCNIKVEEYKRPTFGISFNAPKQRYKLNDTVDVSGSVDALAEFGLDNIKCTYRVVRQTSFPFRYWRGYYPLVEDEQIQFGEMTTDNKGKFNIEIKLEPSSKVIAQQQPVFSYVIYVDATNVQGETQSKSYTLWAGYNDLTINTNLSESVEKSDLAQQRIIVTNLSNEPVQTKITRRFYHIDYQQRYSSELGNLKFDRKLYDDETLRTLFPEFDYYASQDVDNRKTLVYEDQIEVNDQAMLFPVNANKFDCGQYYVELLSVDDSLAKYAATFVLFDTTSSKMPYKSLCWSHLDKNSAQPGEKIHFLIGSSENDVNAWVRVKSGDKILVDKWIKINSKVNDITYEVKEEDRGILSFQAVFVRHNRIFVISETVEVPYENLKLDIELTTMRDVLTPGAEEQWKVIVRDYEKKPVVANLLASMYDASLDQFSALNWFFNINPRLKYPSQFEVDNSFEKSYQNINPIFPYGIYSPFAVRNKPSDLSLVGFEDYPLYYRKNSVTNAKAMGNIVEFKSQMIMAYEIESPDEMVIEEETQNQSSTDKVISEQQSSVRENFNETAFFYPQIETADDGSATFGFTMPDALTRWNLMMLAYTKDLKAGQKQYSFTTSKPLMIMADMPRFCYENDTMWIVANVINTGDESCSPKAKLEIFDAETMRPLDLILSDQTIDLGKIQKARSKSARWKVGFAEDVSLLAFRFSANAKGFTDAEQHMMPVFSNEIFQVQTVPVTVKGQSLMALPLDFLDIENSNERNYSFTFNFSSNPVWYAVQALPYLAEANDQYVETSFYQFYANTLAAHVANSIPELDRYLEKWRSESVNALQSQINMNQDLKAIMAKETPWVLEAKNEAEQKANIAKLLDLNALRYQQKQSLSFLRKKQKNSGGWPWIEGMPESPNVTSYILSGLGKLTSIDAVSSLSQECQNMVQNIVCGAVSYLRQELTNDYRELKDSKMRKNYRVSPNVLDMLYALSYFPQINSTDKYESIERFYLKHLAEQWIDFSFEYQAKAALVLSRKENQSASTLIMQSLKERARNKDDIGMYWTSNNHFGNSNVAVQATIMEAFDEILDDSENMNQMRLWLLTQKRTTQWENNRATAEAIYALLLRGEDWLRDTDDITVKIGNEIINTKGDAGTGFYQRRWNASEITSDFDSVFVENPTNHMAWGGLFRQYFVPIDEVKKASSPLSIKRELFVEKVCEDGPRLVPVEGQTLKVGDKLTVQLTFISAQDMEFVFVKDLRAAGLEPVNHVSGYHYNDGVGYYQSATDGFMGFHIDYLPKGTHKISYSMYVNKEGDFSNGYALIQSLYAPEFSAYSDGMRIKIGK